MAVQEPIDQHVIERAASHLAQSQLVTLRLSPVPCHDGKHYSVCRTAGTVMGIIDAFREIGTQGTASISAVAPGVAEALVATAAGLFTAIPAVIAYNYFLTRIRSTAFRLDSVTIELCHPSRPLHRRQKPVPVGVQG